MLALDSRAHPGSFVYLRGIFAFQFCDSLSACRILSFGKRILQRFNTPSETLARFGKLARNGLHFFLKPLPLAIRFGEL